MMVRRVAWYQPASCLPTSMAVRRGLASTHRGSHGMLYQFRNQPLPAAGDITMNKQQGSSAALQCP